MKKYNIPTAAYETFTDPHKALEYIQTAKMPIVLKADGLALGKGVLICNTLEEAEAGVKEIMEDKKFGSAGNQMVIEVVHDRTRGFCPFLRRWRYDPHYDLLSGPQAGAGRRSGLNTGGMGTFSPSPFYTKEVDEFCKKYIYQPSVDAMKKEGRTFKASFFFGLMLTEDGPRSAGIQCSFRRSGDTGCPAAHEERYRGSL